jgi:hypothetical protein
MCAGRHADGLMKTGEKKEPSINHADRKQITGRFSSASSSGWRNSKKLGAI